MENNSLTQQIQRIRDLVSNTDSVGIVVTEYQTLDKMAAALALYLSLTSAGKNVQVVSKKDPQVEISNLVAIDRVKRNFDGITNKLVVSLPYKEGEVEKVSYNIEGTRLNINLFAAKDNTISFTDDQVQYLRSGSAPTLLFTIGIRKPEELAGVVADDAKAHIVRFDTVNGLTEFGDVTISSGQFSSVSEIVAQVLRDLQMPVDQDVAQNLLDGVSAATNSFTAPTTSAMAFAAAAFTMAQGAQRKALAAQPARQEKPRDNRAPRMPVQPIEALRQDNQSVEPIPQVEAVQAAQPVETPVAQPVEDHNSNSTTEDSDVPSDWFVPKVFKSSKPQE